MKRQKTEKYLMRVYLGDSLIETNLVLTKTEYNKQLTHLKEQHNKNNPDDEFTSEYEHKEKHEGVVTTIYDIFSYGINEIYLIKKVCDAGYIFSK